MIDSGMSRSSTIRVVFGRTVSDSVLAFQRPETLFLAITWVTPQLLQQAVFGINKGEYLTENANRVLIRKGQDYRMSTDGLSRETLRP